MHDSFTNPDSCTRLHEQHAAALQVSHQASLVGFQRVVHGLVAHHVDHRIGVINDRALQVVAAVVGKADTLGIHGKLLGGADIENQRNIPAPSSDGAFSYTRNLLQQVHIPHC